MSKLKSIGYRFIRVTSLAMVALLPNSLLAQAEDMSGECVVLLHGLARTESSMNKMAEFLTAAGYQVVNQSYASRSAAIEELAVPVIDEGLKACGDRPVNFVTHSLGGILLRYYLSNHQIPDLQRVVMLGPPNQGSEVVDKLQDWPGYHWLNGDAGSQLGTDDLSWPSRLGPADFELGVIAGNRSINLILSLLIPGNDDGKVAVERTRLEGMVDHLVVNVSHPFLMKNREVMNQTLGFLQSGHFDHDEPNPGL